MAKINGTLEILGGGGGTSVTLPSGFGKIINLADGTDANDAVNKSQLDAATLGLSWKNAVRVATTAAGTLATDFENGDTIDGVVLSTGDRILIKDQGGGTGAENGIYIVAASGAPTRATDMDDASEFDGSAVFVQEGTTNANRGYTQIRTVTTVDTDAVEFQQFTSGTTFVGGDGIDITGNTISVDTLASGGLKFTSGEIGVEPADFAGAGLEDDGSDNLRIAASAAGTGLAGGGGSALSVDLNELPTEATFDPAADFLSIVDATDSGSDKSLWSVIATAAAGDGLSASSGVFALDLNELTGAAIDVSADSMAFIDATDNSSKKESIADLATAMAGDGLSASSGVFALDLNELSAAVVDVAADSIAIIDATDNSSKKESIADLVSGIAGNGLTASSGVLAITSAKASWTSGTTFNFAHNLGTEDVIIQVFDDASADNETVIVDRAERTDSNNIQLEAAVAPTGAGYRVLVLAI